MTGPGDREGSPALAEVLSRTARRLQEEHGDVEGTLEAITAAAVTVVPHADGCSITYVLGGRRVEPRAWTGELPRSADLLQQRVGEGPCLDAVAHEEVVRVDDVGADPRWPAFGTEAAALGVAA